MVDFANGWLRGQSENGSEMPQSIRHFEPIAGEKWYSAIEGSLKSLPPNLSLICRKNAITGKISMPIFKGFKG
jgi:hypothetical protein